MFFYDKPKSDWDDLDIEDKDYMDIIRELGKLDMNKFVNLYLKPMEPDLYEKLYRAIKKQ